MFLTSQMQQKHKHANVSKLLLIKIKIYKNKIVINILIKYLHAICTLLVNYNTNLNDFNVFDSLKTPSSMN